LVGFFLSLLAGSFIIRFGLEFKKARDVALFYRQNSSSILHAYYHCFEMLFVGLLSSTLMVYIALFNVARLLNGLSHFKVSWGHMVFHAGIKSLSVMSVLAMYLAGISNVYSPWKFYTVFSCVWLSLMMMCFIFAETVFKKTEED
jgi:hypothetical protein